MTVYDWVVFILFLGVLVFAIDRHLCLREVEIDLKEYLGDILVARDSSDGSLRVHFTAEISVLKTFIRKHFKAD